MINEAVRMNEVLHTDTEKNALYSLGNLTILKDGESKRKLRKGIRKKTRKEEKQ